MKLSLSFSLHVYVMNSLVDAFEVIKLHSLFLAQLVRADWLSFLNSFSLGSISNSQFFCKAHFILCIFST